MNSRKTFFEYATKFKSATGLTFACACRGISIIPSNSIIKILCMISVPINMYCSVKNLFEMRYMDELTNDNNDLQALIQSNKITIKFINFLAMLSVLFMVIICCAIPSMFIIMALFNEIKITIMLILELLLNGMDADIIINQSWVLLTLPISCFLGRKLYDVDFSSLLFTNPDVIILSLLLIIGKNTALSYILYCLILFCKSEYLELFYEKRSYYIIVFICLIFLYSHSYAICCNIQNVATIEIINICILNIIEHRKIKNQIFIPETNIQNIKSEFYKFFNLS